VRMPRVVPSGIWALTTSVSSGFSLDTGARGPYASPVPVVERKEMAMKVTHRHSDRLDAASA
jgi:hypothetical protein